MKLNKIASAIAIVGFGLCSAAWSQIVDQAAGTTIISAVPSNVATLIAGTVLEVGSVITGINGGVALASPLTLAAPATTKPGNIAIIGGVTTNYVAAVPYSVTATVLGAPALGAAQTSTRQDTVGTRNGVTSQTLNTFTTKSPALGTNAAPIQSTLGGPGGVSGLGVISDTVKFTKTTTSALNAGEAIAVGTNYFAGSVLGGVTMLVSGTTTATDPSSANAGDSLINATKVITTSAVNNVGTGIKGTDHDFVTKTTYGSTGSVGLCTYCHTPHKATSTLLLWNKTMSNNTFKWDVAATTAGTALPGFSGSTYSGPSAKCLACHDGSVAIGDIGWFAGAGRSALNGKSGVPMNDKTLLDSNLGNQRMVMGNDGQLGAQSDGSSGAYVTDAKANFGGSAVHPVAIPYPLNGAPNVYNASTTGARLATNDFVADPTANNIRLYSDVGGGSIVGKVIPGQTGMECSSCHDVHNKAAVDKYFLRGKMVGSSITDGYICAQCHTK